MKTDNKFNIIKCIKADKLILIYNKKQIFHSNF